MKERNYKENFFFVQAYGQYALKLKAGVKGKKLRKELISWVQGKGIQLSEMLFALN